MGNTGAINESIEGAAKQWSHLYDPDYRLLFNQHTFPMELMSGSKLGEYMIVKYGLIDPNMTAKDVILDASEHAMGEDDLSQEMSKGGVGANRGSIGSNNQKSRMGEDSFDNQSKQQIASPRSTHTNFEKFLRQKEKFEEIKQNAMTQLTGL